jgi:MFS family permease
MTLLAARSSSSAAGPGRGRDAWRFVAAAMFCIGWGGNQFTPLLIVYRERGGYSQVGVDVFLGAYVFGLIPGLLIASALSDRHGRRPLLLAGMIASIAGSGVLAFGTVGGAAAIIGGRMLSGLAIGIAMAVGTSWVKELSAPAFDPSLDSGTGARRSSIALTLGLGVGPGVASVLAQWAPFPLVLPYLVQIALVAVVLPLLAAKVPETRFDPGGVSLRERLRVPLAGHRRFRWVVLPMAPWIFGSAAVAYAVIPQLVDARVGHWALIFTAALTVATLGAGVLVQPVAKRLDTVSTARAVFVSMVLMSFGMALAALTALTHSPWMAAPVAVLLGAAYGIAVVSGLLEVQRIAEPDELAGLTGVYYALAYIGFLIPALLAGLSHWLGYPAMLGALAVVAIGCTAVVGTASSKHLPAASKTAGGQPLTRGV